jgi:hypothetical protein
MPRRNTPQTKSQAKNAKGRRKAASAAHLPGFAPTVNWSAGPAASGIRIGFPAERTVTLNYVSVYAAYQAVAGVPDKQQYRLNSVFDPDYTAAGHQPMGFDQWAEYYNHYVVESCHYDIQMSTREISDNAIVGTYLSDDFTVPSSVYELIELGGAASIHERGSTLPHIFKGEVDIGKFMNRKDIASDSELRAAVTTNPTEQVFLTTWFLATNVASQVTLDAIVKLSFRVRFMEPKDLGPSSQRVPVLSSKVDFPSLPKCDSTSRPDQEQEYVTVRVPVKRDTAPPH